MSKSTGGDIRRAYRKVIPEAIRRQVGPVIYRWYIRAEYMVDSSMRNMSPRLRSLQGKYSGQRCFIMGTGPSLNRMDLELFGQEYVWALNKCYLLFDRISWRPAFYVAVDMRVVPDIAVEINDLVRSLPQMTSFFPVYFRERRVLHSRPNVYWYRQIAFDETNLPDGMFTRDASEWVTGVRSVTIAALQLAVYLGFDPIYLIGCDTSYSVPSTVQFEGGDANKFISTEDDDLSHFDPRYFGAGSKWHEPHVDKMIFHYQQARRVCESLGVSVYNATVGGKLEVFPRVDYTDLF